MLQVRKLLAESAFCVALLLLAPVLIYGRALVAGGVPMDLHAPLFQAPWQDARPAGLEPADNPFTTLHAARYYPWYRFLHYAVKDGRSLQWNPLEGFGVPFEAAWQTRVFSPFSVPVMLMPLSLGITLSLLLKMVVAGWAAFYAARRLGLNAPMAFVVGLSYQLSGPVLLRAVDPMGDVLPWFPLLVVSLERLLQGDLRSWPLGATVITLMGMGGAPDVFAVMGGFTVIYVLARCIMDCRNLYVPHAATGLLVIWTAGLLIISVQLFPYIEFRRYGNVTGPGLDPLSPHGLIALLAPGLLDPSRPQAAPGLYLLYPGAGALFFLALWAAVRPYLNERLRCRGEAMLVTAMILTAAPFAASHLLPPVWRAEMPDPGAFFVVNAFVVPLLAAAAAQQWLVLDPEQCRATLPRLAVCAPVYWGGLFVVALWSLVRRGVPWGTTALHLSLPALAMLAVAGLLLITLLKPWPRLMTAGFCLLALLQVWVFRGGVAYTPQERVFPETPLIASLRSQEMRIGGSAGLASWPLAGNGIAQVHNPSGIVLNRYRDFAKRLNEEPLLLRRCGARGLLLTREDIRGVFAPVRPALRIKNVYSSGAVFFEEVGAELRARVIYAGRKIEAFDPTLIRYDSPPVVEGVVLMENDKTPPAPAKLLPPETHTRLKLQLETKRAGVLVLADSWYPGWIARVDGEERVVRPVDGIFRGVEVKEGAQSVVFAYEPKPFRFGLAMTELALLGLLAGFLRLAMTWRESLRPLN